MFLSTTGDPLNDAQQAAFERYIRAGGGYVGIDAAADTEYTWTWYGKLVGAYSATTRPARRSRRARRGPRSPLHGRACPARWHRTDEWYNYQQPEGAVVGGGGTDWSPREAGVHVLAKWTRARTARTTATRRMTTIRSRGASATTAAARGTRAWATAGLVQRGALPRSPPRRPRGRCGRGPGRRLRGRAGEPPPTVTALRNPGGDVQPGDPVAFTATGTDPDGDTLTYAWDFGDGGTATTKDAMHTYTEVGVFHAKVTVLTAMAARPAALLQVTVTPLAGDNSRRSASAASCRASWRSNQRLGELRGFRARGHARLLRELSGTATSTATAAELTVRDPSRRRRAIWSTAAARWRRPCRSGRPTRHRLGVRAGARERVPPAVAHVPGAVQRAPMTIGFKQSINATDR